MRHFITSAAGAALLLCGIFATHSSAAEKSAAENSPASKKAAELVTAALQAEAEGSAESRDALLKQALAADANHAPARWHSGFVQWNGRWVKVDDVPKIAGADKRFDLYRKRRTGMIDTADNQRELARWCRKMKLPDQARTHWLHVLEFDRSDAEALAALDLQLHAGQLMTSQRATAQKTAATEAAQAMRKWQLQVASWRKAILSGDEHEREQAYEALASLKDPSSLGALVQGLAPVDGDLVNQKLIEAIGRMRTADATRTLVNFALGRSMPATSDAACAELKKRPMFNYVPQLIASLPSTRRMRVEARHSLCILPAGLLVSLETELFVSDLNADYLFADNSLFSRLDENVGPRASLQQSLAAASKRRAEFTATATYLAAQSEVQQRQIDQWRERVKYVLHETTGFVAADDAKSWEKQFADYYDWSQSAYPTAERPVPQFVSNTSSASITYVPRHSCFAAGTLVMAAEGLRPIESIEGGDLVLAQDPLTGQLAYKAVQQRTLRVPTSLLQLTAGSDTIEATGGHPFWTEGEGWGVAKDLRASHYLHAVCGPVRVSGTESLPPREVYNLIVADWHTFFVGQQGLLVHDNSPIEEVSTVVPGLDFRDAAH